MYERFTDRARRVMEIAESQARASGEHEIGTQHLLIALANENSNVAVNVLRLLGFDQSKICAEVERQGLNCDSNEDSSDVSLLEVVGSAMEEARTLNHNYVGTEHLLLAVTVHPECRAFTVLRALGVVPEDVRSETLSLLGHGL